MAFITADRVLDSSTSTGTGPFVVSGTPAAGYRTFSAVMSVGDTCYYSIQGQTTSEWEVGLGTYSSTNTLTRTTIYSSSNAGSAVTFSAGTKNVFITVAASRAPQLDPSGNITALGTPASATLTNATGLSLTTGVTGVLPPANGGSLAWQSVQTSNFAAVAGNAYPVNTTSGAVTVTLPASPTAGQQIVITDYASTFSTNKCTINPNGNKINAATGNVLLTSSSESIALVYIDATRGWIPYSGFLSSPITYSVSYLVVAGGGGGGAGPGGGGGAGGLLSGTTTVSGGNSYTITVGAGGAATTGTWPQNVAVAGNAGNNSVFGSFTATGGGFGGANAATNGGSGGSGGGGAGSTSPGATGGSGTSGQGNTGGSATSNQGDGAGGGGAGAVGGNTSGSGASSLAGSGGSGSASTITGSSVTYAGGGGGGSASGSTNAGNNGGSGGGGRGGFGSTVAAVAGTANTGGGGGGGGRLAGTTNYQGAAGGSGVVILSVPTVNYSGTTTGSPTVTTSGTNTILTFTTSGSYTA